MIRWTSPEEGQELYDGQDIGLIEAMTVSEDGKTLAIGANNKIVTIESGGKPRIQKTKGRCGFVEILSDGQLLSAVDRQFYLGKRQSQPTNDRIHTGFHLQKLNRLVGLPFLEGYFTVWDFNTLEIVQHVKIPVKTHGTYSAALTSDQERLYVSCSDEVIRVYDTRSFEVLNEMFVSSSVNVIALSPGDELLACATDAYLELRKSADFSLQAVKRLGGKVEQICFTEINTLVCGFKSGGLVQVKI